MEYYVNITSSIYTKPLDNISIFYIIASHLTNRFEYFTIFYNSVIILDT